MTKTLRDFVRRNLEGATSVRHSTGLEALAIFNTQNIGLVILT
jgi:hypothetical protein